MIYRIHVLLYKFLLSGIAVGEEFLKSSKILRLQKAPSSGRSIVMRNLFLDPGLVRQAVDDVEDAIFGMVTTSAMERIAGHIVVMDPIYVAGGDASFEQAILYEHSLGEHPEEWPYDYKRIARAKAKQSWETGLSSRELLNDYPLYVADGDSPWVGSIVVDYLGNKIVLSCSGYHQPEDEMVCWFFFHRMVCLAREAIPKDTLVGGESVDTVKPQPAPAA